MNEKHKFANTTEEILNAFFEIAFLEPWTIPNPYFKTGKELCDCLVIIGNNVILVSDKDYKYNNQPVALKKGANFEAKWKRWYKKSIIDSANQLIGAKKKIEQESQLFYDGKASQKIHLNIPKNPNIYLIAVSSDSSDLLSHEVGYCGLGIHNEEISENNLPYFSGTTYQDNFIHHFSRSVMHNLLKSLDTAGDLINYLNQREYFFNTKFKEICIYSEYSILRFFYKQDINQQSIPNFLSYCANRQLQLRIDNKTSSKLHVEKTLLKDPSLTTFKNILDDSQYKKVKLQQQASYHIDNIINIYYQGYKQKQNASISKHLENLANTSRDERMLMMEAYNSALEKFKKEHKPNSSKFSSFQRNAVIKNAVYSFGFYKADNDDDEKFACNTAELRSKNLLLEHGEKYNIDYIYTFVQIKREGQIEHVRMMQSTLNDITDKDIEMINTLKEQGIIVDIVEIEHVIES